MLESHEFSSETHTAAQVVKALDLQPLDQEGGYFRRTAESGLWVKQVESTAEATRAYSVIYALFTPDAFSALHRLTTDEIWCWHAGDSLESLRLYPDGHGEWVLLGSHLAMGSRLQDVVAAGVWQGTKLVAGGRWALVSCIMAPEFRWEDFELGDRAELAQTYPNWRDAIANVTRANPPAGER
ncbi:cupin domain-containing protein [Synoicihabitans lomoniglobus]|uniref:Cupin domain-containing protein n=1 Tax=Synoicihabitans lomoniglobus TaxID=2909285 RepID=A0AAE9ZYC5_9BACT|nr:cupin domain-containing protein [Opitutaceae bacterium LMO-M01]WED63448.1 cupin domain-containing protein [Opitutaceae bacterium LMO-M01]